MLQTQYLTIVKSIIRPLYRTKTIIQNNMHNNVPQRKKYMAWELKGRSKCGSIYHYY